MCTSVFAQQQPNTSTSNIDYKQGVVNVSTSSRKIIDYLVPFKKWEEVVGTGLAVDTPCTHILTNRHGIEMAGKRKLYVEGVRVAHVDLPEPGDPVDAALLTLERSIVGCHSVTFALQPPAVGMPVTRVSRHDGDWDITGGTITPDTAVKYPNNDETYVALTADIQSRGGNSGGAFKNDKGEVIGLVFSIPAPSETNHNIPVQQTFALYNQTLAKFLHKKAPTLWAQHFLPETAIHIATVSEPLPCSADGSVLSAPPAITPGTDPKRFISLLRVHAAEVLGDMENVTAIDTLLFTGANMSGKQEKWRFDFLERVAHFRKIRKNGSFGPDLTEFPVPSQGVRPSDDWSLLLRAISLGYGMNLRYHGTSICKGQPVEVFSYGPVQLNWREPGWQGAGMAEGQIITTRDFYPRAISQELVLPEGHMTIRVRTQVEYGSTPYRNEQRWLPLSHLVSAQMSNGHTYQAAGTWNYRVFASTVELKEIDDGPGLEKEEAPHSPRPR